LLKKNNKFFLRHAKILCITFSANIFQYSSVTRRRKKEKKKKLALYSSQRTWCVFWRRQV